MQTQPSGARVPPSWIPPCVVGGPSDSDGDAILDALRHLVTQIDLYGREHPMEAWSTLYRWKDYVRDAVGMMDGVAYIEAVMMLEDIETALTTVAPNP